MTRERILAGLPLLALLPVGLKPDWMPWPWAAAAALPVAAALVAWSHFLIRGRGTAPFIPIVATFYGLCFGFTAFLEGFRLPADDGLRYVYRYTFSGPERVLHGPAIYLAAAGAVLGVAAMLGGRRLLDRPFPQFALPPGAPARLELLAWAMIGLHLAYFAVPGMTAIPSIGQFLQPAGYIGFAVLFARWLDKRLPRWQAALLFGLVVPGLMVMRLVLGTLTPTIYFFLLMFILSLRVSVRLPWKSLVLGAAAFVVFYPAIAQYRHVVHGHFVPGWEQGTERGLGTFVKVLEHRGGQDLVDADALANGADTFVRRMAILPILGQVMRLVPETYPHLHGETYRPLLTTSVPRLLYPGKPEERFGGEFAHRYEFTYPMDQTTINVAWLTEQYLNFGILGVLLGMPLMGLLMAVLDRMANAASMRSEEAAVGIGIIFPLVFQESNFSLMVGSLPLLAATTWLYFRLGLRGAGVR